MATARTHKKDPLKLVVDVKIDGHRMSKVCDTVEDAIALLESDPSFKGFRSPPYTFDQLCERYLRRCDADGLRTIESIRRVLRMARTVLGAMVANEINTPMLMAWANGLSRDYAYTTVVVAVHTLGYVYREAVQSGLLHVDPSIPLVEQYRKPSPGTHGRLPSPHDEERALKACRDASERLLLRFFLDAGFTAGEIAALRRRHIVNGVISVEDISVAEMGLLPVQDHRRRLVPMSPELQFDVTALLEEQPRKPDDFFFQTENNPGAVVGPHVINYRAVQTLIRAGLGAGRSRTDPKKRLLQAQFTPVQMSAAAAVKWLRHGVHPIFVMRRMGYGTYSPFARRFGAYIHAYSGGAGIEALDDLIWGEGASHRPGVAAGTELVDMQPEES